VIGAGLAGLAAADALSAAGVAVTVLEARNRVGGRVWSQRVGNGALVEMGAEFVTEGYQRVPQLVERLGLRLAPMGMSFTRRQPRGGIGCDEPALEAGVAEVERALADGRGAGRSVAQLLAELPLDAGVRELIGCRIQVSYAHPIDRIAAAAVRDVAHLFHHVEARRVAGGNQQLAEGLAGPLRVLLEAPAAHVRHDGHRLRVNGELDADAVVIAVPAPAAVRLAFDPPLPAWKIEALAGVVYGQAAKLAVPLTAPAPASSVLSVPEHFWTWTARAGDGEVARLVTAFAGSGPAVAALAVQDGPRRYLERLAALRPDLALDREAAVLSTWPEGAYSAREAAVLDPAVARPVGRIAFAGEHTEPIWYATMEGALRSGERAAQEVVERLAAAP
jgi:monoamine oxidase